MTREAGPSERAAPISPTPTPPWARDHLLWSGRTEVSTSTGRATVNSTANSPAPTPCWERSTLRSAIMTGPRSATGKRQKLLTQAFGENSSRVGQMEWLLGSMYLNKHDLNAALHHSLLALVDLDTLSRRSPPRRHESVQAPWQRLPAEESVRLCNGMFCSGA